MTWIDAASLALNGFRSDVLAHVGEIETAPRELAPPADAGDKNVVISPLERAKAPLFRGYQRGRPSRRMLLRTCTTSTRRARNESAA
jgi:hypothetical protein